jgi:hypothetical protein
MRARILSIALIALIPIMSFGRGFRIIDPKTLIEDSKLVFVGKVQSIKPSGIATTFSYPTWEGVSFPWLSVNVEVLVPFKGVQKGDTVQVMMLSILSGVNKEHRAMYSPPMVLEPDTGDIFFLCLASTPITNAFAAFTGPYDENLSVFPLHRSHETGEDSLRDVGKRLFLDDDQRFAPIWQLVNPAGDILPEGVAKLRDTYAAEIKKDPANHTVYLEWQAHTNAYSWVSDEPKGIYPTNANVRK